MPDLPLARSLVEAYVHLDLVTAGRSRDATVTQEADGWVVRLGDVAVLVPGADELVARQEGLTFGSGLSELIDPGQWVLVAATYASRALEADLLAAAAPEESALEEVAAEWRFAADAVAEALKFFPPGMDELPPDAFWTEMGRSLRESQPERVTREKLERDLALYRQSLDDFLRLHDR